MSEQPKSKNQEKNEAKRLAKLAKYEAKMAKLKESEPSSTPKLKKEIKKVPVQPQTTEFVNTTPKGDKKGFFLYLND